MYNSLLKEAAQHGIRIHEKSMPSTTKGLYADNVIWINKHLQTIAEKVCILAEEVGHHHTSVGDITDQSNITNRKQEHRARAWAYNYLVSLSRIVEAGQAGISGRHDIAEWMGVTEEYLQESIEYYQSKYDIYTIYDGYKIFFDPLNIESLDI